MRQVVRNVLVATAGIGCAVSCAPSARVGLHSLGWADASRTVQVGAERSVAVAFTPGRNGQIAGVNVVASRAGAGPVGILAYVVTPQDPATGTPARPVAAPAGAEPQCFGSVTDTALSASAQSLTIYGSGCPVQAGHTYWIQLATVLAPADIYAREKGQAGRVLSRSTPTAAWKKADVTGGLEVSPVTRAAP
jgi:hypothetical protein